MVDLGKARDALDRIDWSFPHARTSELSVHSLYSFPGNFIPQIPRALIQILSTPGELVFDPFLGSGTTAVEAALLGRRSVGSDVLSVCVFLARGKIAATCHRLDQELVGGIIEQLTFEHECHSSSFGRNDEGSDPALAEWYHTTTLGQLRFLWSLIEDLETNERDVLSVVFADVLFACASPGLAVTASGRRRRHHWGWVADNVRPRSRVAHNAVEMFRDRLARLSSNIDQGDCLYEPIIEQEDARETSLSDGSVDLIVTSPPYVGVIDYVHANRLLYMWMNWSIHQEREIEIGARYRRNRKFAVSEYREAMSACWMELSRVLKPGAYCALVIGESRKFPGAVDAVIKDLQQHLELIWGPEERNVSRRRVADRAASRAIEQTVVLRKKQ